VSSQDIRVPVTFDRVAKSFGAVRVLEEMTLTVEPGEFLVLLGASGSGKTTALRILAGLETASSGRVKIGENDVTELLPKYRDVAMVFQSYALYPHKTVAENIGFPLKVRKVPQAEMQAAIKDAARQVQLDALLERYPRQLSGGQRQRVALARAIVRRPAVFLMDEPLSNLDAKLRGHMRAELKHMQHSLGITTIYVTHDQIEAMTLAHRVAILEKGVLQQLDTPKAIYNDPANLFVAGFIGSPPMNFLKGSVRSGRFEGPSGALGTATKAGVEKAVLGVRPEDARITGVADAAFQGRIYTTELIGDHVLVTAEAQGQMLTVKAMKDFEGEVGDPIGITADPKTTFVFDEETGNRVR
jgi:multiple sugar transport system ATP-binding protein